MINAICCVPVSPLRAQASHKAEMVSQQLFGETCEILERAHDDWMRVRCEADGYEGWCTGSHLAGIDEVGKLHSDHGLAPEWVNQVQVNGQPMMIPLGSHLPGGRDGGGGGHETWGKNSVEYQGKAWDAATASQDAETVRQLAFKFLNTPYLWGGKSVYGIDCSGFTQMVLRFFDVSLLRDAWQQANQGEPVGFLQEARTGDLAFFDNEEEKIIHVGLLLGDDEIIHASGKVRIDKIDNMGIVHAETSQRTHRLRIIKRFL